MPARRIVYALAFLAAWLVPGPAALAAHPLVTSLQEPAVYADPASSDLALTRVAQAGARRVRIDLTWSDVAPGGSQKPAGFDASNPGDPQYNWSAIDGAVIRAAAHGIRPFLNVSEAPEWADRGSNGRQGTVNPDPAELAAFAHAAALRYSGTYDGLPRVDAWEVWNEVNASFFFVPQWKDRPGGTSLSAVLYRRMVNDFAAAVHGVNPDDIVIAGSLYPFSLDRPGAQAVAPLRFMRELFCISKRLRLKPHCGEPLQFDAWSHHPYTSGGPGHKTLGADSVSIAQLPRMRRLLRAAIRHGRVISRHRVQFWVSEFGWDTNPPDPQGVPVRLQARWISDAFYRMWKAGVTMASWFQMRDGYGDSARFADGLWSVCPARPEDLGCDKAKLSLESFRFPFVAFRTRRHVKVWGRTPGGVPGRVVIEHSRRGHWRRVARLRTDRYGIVERRLRRARFGSYRARLADGSQSSLPFSLKRPHDFPISPPVG